MASLEVAKASMKSPSASCVSPTIRIIGHHVSMFPTQQLQVCCANNLEGTQLTWHSYPEELFRQLRMQSR